MKKKPTAGIILAAGESRRFGQLKQTVKLNHKCLFEWVVDAALESRLETVVLVLGYQHQNILQCLEGKKGMDKLQTVINTRFKEGQGRSLGLGVSKVLETHASVMFLLADQPMVEATTINHLLECFWASEKKICVPVYRGRRGNPTLFSRLFFNSLMEIKGDIGGRKIIASNPDHILEVEIVNPLIFFDVDTPRDLKTLSDCLKA